MVGRALRALVGLMVLAAALRAGAGNSTTAWGDLRTTVEAVQAAAGGAAKDAAIDRSAGTPGADASADYFAKQLEAVTGEKVYRQRYTLTVPVVELCTAHTLGDSPMPVPLSPLLPSGAQPAALPESQRELPVVYVGRGKLEELRGKDLANRFVAMEIDSAPGAWQTAAALGARAVIFVGETGTPVQAFLDKQTAVPIGVPRFFCDDAASVAAFRGGRIEKLRIDVTVRWQERQVENLLCLIPGRQRTAALDVKEKNWFKQLVVIQTRYDASSQVMTRAPGATQSLNAAAAIELAEQLAKQPDRMSTLIVLTAGDEWNICGTRELYALLGRGYWDPARIDVELPREIAEREKSLKLCEQTVAGLESLIGGEAAALRHDGTRAAVTEQMLRTTSQLEERLQKSRLDAATGSKGENTAELDQLKLEALLAKAVLDNRETPNAAQLKVLITAAKAVLPLWATERGRRVVTLENLRGWLPIRKVIGPRFPMVHMTLALSTGGGSFGFFARSHYAGQVDQTGPMAPFAREFRRYDTLVRDLAQAAGREGTFVADSMENRFTLETYFPVKTAFSSDAAGLYSQPAGAFATIDDAGGRIDTPGDTADRLDFFSAQVQLHDLSRLLLGEGKRTGALTDPLFYGRTQLSKQVSDQMITLLERSLGETVPTLGAPEILIGGECEDDGRPLGPTLAGTRRQEWYITHVDGSATFRGTPVLGHVRIQALDFNASGLPVRSLAANQSDTRGLVSDFVPNDGHPQRAILFECQRLDALGLFDPRYMEYLDKLDVLDARRRDKAQFSNIYAREGIAAVFMPRDIRWQVLASKGSVANRMLLINADAAWPEGRGFDTTDLVEIGPLAYRNALDLKALNGKRQADLEKFGISSDRIKDLQKRAAEALLLAEEGKRERRFAQWLGATDAAWSLESQVYQDLINTSNGVIKGVIFLLLGIIPFSYFLERLLIGTTNVYRQIAWFAGFFLLMTGALWFHPAFRISTAPLMILLAFLILILSSTVIYILLGKFEEEIRRLRGAAAAAHMTSLNRGAVLGAAIRLGLSNMRRRGMRTTLTLVTLVLLTFTLLCFTSVRETVQVTPRRVAGAPPDTPPGIMLRLPEWRTLPDSAEQTAMELATAISEKGTGVTAQRWWYASERPEQMWYVPVRQVLRESKPSTQPAMTPATGTALATTAQSSDRVRTFYATGLLGLEPGEAVFHAEPLEKTLPGFGKLAADSGSLGVARGVCWLPTTVRDSMAVSVGDPVDVLGTRLTVAGFFDPKSFAAVRGLTGDMLTPMDAAGAQTIAGSSGSGGSVGRRRPETSFKFLDPRSIAIVPAGLVRNMGGRMTSIMIQPAGLREGEKQDAAVLQLAEDFAWRSAFTVYVSDGKEVRSINADEASRPQDLETVLVPMLIAGVIVLNTMLGAVAERTREIHVYTSVGLAPSHVGMLFLAEAAALGTLGVVFGYIFGQGLATILTWTGLMGGVDLNYSSMAAVTTMGLVLALVMASSLWPARAATRVAAPSLKHDWKLPKPDGDTLRVELPFTVNETAARGVCAFLEEFLTTTTQAGTGRFTADNIQAFVDETSLGKLRGLACRIWLSPYDLGVIEAFWLGIYPTEDRNVYEVKLMLMREAGNPAAWHRLNRPFLVEIRKQFLLWRTVSESMVEDYVKKSDVMFGKK